MDTLEIEVKGHTLRIEGEYTHDRGDRWTAPYTAFVVADTWLVLDGRERLLKRWNNTIEQSELIEQYHIQCE